MAVVQPVSITPGLIDLGPANSSAIGRLVNYAAAIVKSGKPIPESPFIEWAADRVTGEDKQDLVIFLQGRRGSGKSYSCLYIGKRLGQAIAKRMGGKWQDYFSLEYCATLEDNEAVIRILNNAGMYKVVLIDDCSLAISNRGWNSPQNRNFNALLSICRTNRWILLLTAPLKSHIDNQVREMTDITGTVYKSFHKGVGINILKMTSSEISTVGNKEYTKKLHFEKKKVDFWVTFRPDEELARQYDIQRDEGTKRINLNIVETGSFKSSGKITDSRTTAEKNLEKMIAAHGEGIRETVEKNPDISVNQIAVKFCISHQTAARICDRMGISRTGRV